VEHLLEDEAEEVSATKKLSVSKPLYENELPSFMKSTKAFEALVAVPVEEPPAEPKPIKKKTASVELINGEVLCAATTFMYQKL